MATPKNCNECKHRSKCKSYYGGLGCLIRKYIKPVEV